VWKIEHKEKYLKRLNNNKRGRLKEGERENQLHSLQVLEGGINHCFQKYQVKEMELGGERRRFGLSAKTRCEDWKKKDRVTSGNLTCDEHECWETFGTGGKRKGESK